MPENRDLVVNISVDDSKFRKQMRKIWWTLWWWKHGPKVILFLAGYVIADIVLGIAGFIFGW